VIPGVEVKLDGGSTNQNGTGGGEILVRGPNVTPGYYHLEEENRQAFQNGWFRTGDLGVIDADGFLTITGRKKNLFKTSGGKYVSPEKLENLFQGHPYVAQILILGDGRRFVSALIVPNFARLETLARSKGIHFKDRKELVENGDILAFMQQQLDQLNALLPPHEKIRQIGLLPREFNAEEGELSATQKIKRRVAEEHFRVLIEDIYLRHAPQSQQA
jgi:long-chain acyl-CoA synthetase